MDIILKCNVHENGIQILVYVYLGIKNKTQLEPIIAM